jgi:DNA polymerase-3 subunit alpha
MKRHHAAAFAAANLSAVMDDTDKVRQFHDDAVENGVTVLPPDIHASGHRFMPVDAKTVRYGLGAVRGTGQSAIESIVAARGNGPFLSLFDFCSRVDKRLVNRRAIEALIRAGAFDGLDANRASLLASVGRAMEAAEQAERQASQVSLFGESEATHSAAFALVPAKPWDTRTRLTEEKVALGFCLSGHLFSVYAPELGAFPRTPLAKLQPALHPVWIAGIVNSARVQMTRRGRMMVVMLDDGTAQLEITVFNELFEKHREKLKEDSLLVVSGTAKHDEFAGGMRVTAEDLLDLAAMRVRFAARIRLSMNGQADAGKLQELLAPYRVNGGATGSTGACSVLVQYEAGGVTCEIALGDAWKVKPDEGLITSLGDWLAPENVRVVYGAG